MKGNVILVVPKEFTLRTEYNWTFFYEKLDTLICKISKWLSNLV